MTTGARVAEEHDLVSEKSMQKVHNLLDDLLDALVIREPVAVALEVNVRELPDRQDDALCLQIDNRVPHLGIGRGECSDRFALF